MLIRSSIFSILVSLLFSTSAFAIRPDLKNLPIGLAPFEKNLPLQRAESPSLPPVDGPVHSLGEWEESIEAMTLWSNVSWVKALSENGKVRLLADSASDKKWWQGWVQSNSINASKIDYFVVPTDSIWVRDYGPWYIVDAEGKFGLIDNIYNRPRPNDDKVPEFISKQLNLPLYKTGLVHTGGNYYSDGAGSAFSSTLVFTENSNLKKDEVLGRMNEFLGIQDYITSPLSPKITIEHLDTFGKLVAPDTWVFSEFPPSSRHYKSSEDMVALIRTMRSPYGTPYKIYRMKMTVTPNGSSERYRAYINSFISNGVLYFPTYGDDIDKTAAAVYQKALPGYKIQGVESENTEWGDSVHCRSRNLINWNTVFIFPHVPAQSTIAGNPVVINADIFPSQDAVIKNAAIVWKIDGGIEQTSQMSEMEKHKFTVTLPAQQVGRKVLMYFTAEDSKGVIKTAPIRAPSMQIDIQF